MLQHAPGRP